MYLTNSWALSYREILLRNLVNLFGYGTDQQPNTIHALCPEEPPRKAAIRSNLKYPRYWMIECTLPRTPYALLEAFQRGWTDGDRCLCFASRTWLLWSQKASLDRFRRLFSTVIPMNDASSLKQTNEESILRPSKSLSNWTSVLLTSRGWSHYSIVV